METSYNRNTRTDWMFNERYEELPRNSGESEGLRKFRKNPIISLSEIPNWQLAQTQGDFANSKYWRNDASRVNFLLNNSAINRNADTPDATLDPFFLFRQGINTRDYMRKRGDLYRSTSTKKE